MPQNQYELTSLIQQQTEHRSQIDIFITYPCTRLITKIEPVEPELEIIGFIFMGLLFEPAIRMVSNREWRDLTNGYKNRCETKGIFFASKATDDRTFFVHPFLFYSPIIKIIEEELKESGP